MNARAADTAIVRIEQLYPFPEAEFAEMLARYPAAGEVVWVQEEPRNMGAWAFVRGWIQPTVQAQHRQIGYAGRPESASTAPGSAQAASAGTGGVDRAGIRVLRRWNARRGNDFAACGRAGKTDLHLAGIGPAPLPLE